MKNLFILCFAVASTSFVQAQKFSFGVKSGVNAHDWYFNNANSSTSSILFNQHKPKLGYELGLTACQKLSQKISLNEEALFSQRNNMLSNNDWALKTQYLAIPVFLSFNVFKPLSIDLGGEYSRVVKFQLANSEYLFDSKDFASTLIGIRYNFLEKFNIHCRFVQTINKISQIELTDFNAVIIGKLTPHSHTLSLAFGYQF